MFRLFEWVYGTNSFVLIDKWPVFKVKRYCKAVFQTQEAIYSLSIPTISTIKLNINNKNINYGNKGK